MSARLGLALLVLAGAGCAAPRAMLPPATLERLAAQEGAWLDGEVLALLPTEVIEQRDFAFAADLSPDGTRVAYTHLAGDGFRLGVVDLPFAADRARDVVLNAVDFDVEAVAFAPGGERVVTAGRDGVVRVLELPGLATRTSGIIDAPLSALAIHPSGAFLAVGDARGGVHFLSLPDLSPMGTLEAHADEVRGLAFTAGGALVSGSWDRTVAVHATEQTVERVASARVQPLREQGLVMLRATVNGRAQIPMALDARVPAVVLTAKAAEDAGLSPSSRVLEIPTALGLQRAPIAERQRLHFRELGLEADVAICDACVPKGAQGILGAPFEAAVGVVFAPDGAAELTIREGREVPAVPVVRANLTRRHALQAHVNAVALDASGGRVALALSDVPARRTREIYQREKAGIEEPLAPGNAAVVLELSSGRELTRQAQHRGVVSAVALSPDGRTLASGGWDRRVLLRSVATGVEVGQWKGGWSIRSLRFGRDGRRLVAAAWTPINATGDQRSDPSVQLFELDYVAPDVRSASASGP